MSKYAIFAFQGELMCFQHVLLNVLDLQSKGYESKVIIEGEAVKLVKDLEESGNKLYKRAKEMGLIAAICKACSAKLGVLDYNKNVGIPMGDEMGGHPAMSTYIEQGYEIITL
ncbi:MAG TPA: cytoplasmic protein [Clostridia bacterium]|nr:cytoplasmic protein [Clostridia bacterium]